MKGFTYTKPNGEVSERKLYVINFPSDSYFGIDLSEFSEEEQDYYNKALTELHKGVEDEIEKLGLAHNYRRFKEDRMS